MAHFAPPILHTRLVTASLRCFPLSDAPHAAQPIVLIPALCDRLFLSAARCQEGAGSGPAAGR